MDSLIQISKINDFIFCPHSLYLHTIFDNFSKEAYQESTQIVGSIKHENIENCSYSTSQDVLQGVPVYSNKYGLLGKIDLLFVGSNTLVERKFKIKKIYDGYKWQLYAQYFCLIEMGYKVSAIFLHSLSDNKRYEISIPNKNDERLFVELLNSLTGYKPGDNFIGRSKAKCINCIYSSLCSYC